MVSKRFFRFVSDSMLLCACSIFLISTLSPFLTVDYYFPREENDRNFSVIYWTYKAYSSRQTGTTIFLGNYWFSDADVALTREMNISWMLVAIFLLQILTLVSGIISLLRASKVRILTLISSIVTASLMSEINLRVNGYFDGTILIAHKNFLIGYGFANPSIYIFLLACALLLYSNR